jgi:hypothetical protein
MKKSRDSEPYSVVFLKSVRVLEEDLGFIQVSPTIIYEDNNVCITLKILDILRTFHVISTCDTCFFLTSHTRMMEDSGIFTTTG